MSKWLFVNESLPPYGEKVLVCTKDQEVVVGYLAPPAWKSDQSIRGDGTVICWQPLNLSVKPMEPVKPKKTLADYLKIVK